MFEVGQDINLSDLAWSPLHTAAAGGSTTCAAALLDTEPRLATLPTVNGFLPAHIAALHGHAEVLQLLLEGPEAAAAGTQTEEGLLPLHCAAMDGRIECVRLLLGVAPASAAAQTDAGTTALHIASMCARPLGGGSDHAAVVRLLLAADPRLASMPDIHGRSAQHVCCGLLRSECHWHCRGTRPDFASPSRGLAAAR